MTEEQPQQKKKSAKPVGGINAYRTFGSPNDQPSEHVDTSTAERPGVQTSSSPGTQMVSSPNIRKSKHPEWKQQTIYLPPALIKWLKHHAVQTELEISEIAVLAFKEYQERHS